MFNECKPDIIGGIQKNIKYGNRSNMGFRFGENVEVRNRFGEKSGVRQYSVDFNGTRELIKSI